MRIPAREYQGSLPERASCSKPTSPTTLSEEEGGVEEGLENLTKKKTEELSSRFFPSLKEKQL